MTCISFTGITLQRRRGLESQTVGYGDYFSMDSLFEDDSTEEPSN
jgi:hypothetical protein